MAKYSVELKLYLVKSYASGQLGFSEIHEEFGVPNRMLLNWYQRFKYHGIEAFSKKHSHYDADFKLRVLNHQQTHQLSAHETVAFFNIRGGSGVVSRWRRQYDLGGIRALEPKPKGRQSTMKQPNKKDRTAGTPEQKRIKELEEKLLYLEAENAYLKKLDALLQKKEQAKKANRLPKKKRV